MRTHNIGFYNNRLGEAILMSTHNIGFYEEISKNISYHQIRTFICSSELRVQLTLISLFQR